MYCRTCNNVHFHKSINKNEIIFVNKTKKKIKFCFVFVCFVKGKHTNGFQAELFTLSERRQNNLSRRAYSLQILTQDLFFSKYCFFCLAKSTLKYTRITVVCVIHCCPVHLIFLFQHFSALIHK